MQRLVVLPPGVTPAAAAALRAAVQQLNNDPAFAEDALKAIGFVPEYAAGPDTNREVRQALVVKPEIRAFTADYIRKAGK
jgi:tripartite-type tricarboxylate transporter receptor subunit TctC